MKYIDKPVLEIEEDDKVVIEEMKSLVYEIYDKFGYDVECLTQDNQLMHIDISEAFEVLNILSKSFCVQEFE